MNFEVEPIRDTTFGARVTGLKLAELDEATFADLYQAWLEYALLIFPGQHLSTAEQTTFTLDESVAVNDSSPTAIA